MGFGKRRKTIQVIKELDSESDVNIEHFRVKNEIFAENENSIDGIKERQNWNKKNKKGPTDYDEESNSSEEYVNKKGKKNNYYLSDEDFEEEETDYEENSSTERILKKEEEESFIASDQENQRTKRRVRRRNNEKPMNKGHKRILRSRVILESDTEHEEEEEFHIDSIEKEIEELYDSSNQMDNNETTIRRRRQRKNNETNAKDANSGFNSEKKMDENEQKRDDGDRSTELRKLLFPVGGPFGGGDVVSLYGNNITPIGLTYFDDDRSSNFMMLNKNSSDYEMSEDELDRIEPKDLEEKILQSANILNAKLYEFNKIKKHDNSLSDTDPLGIDTNIDFSVVGGFDNYINQLKEMIILPLMYPELYQKFHITPPRGVLFHGPPGTGKTLMARALASTCSSQTNKVNFFMRKGADCLSKWVGEAERQLRLLFDEAKNQQPSIIFFDEIDGLAPVRSLKQEQIHASIVSTLLALMDGMDNRGQVIVIGATNRPDAIDPALRRPGRFDREFYFSLPDINSRKKIIKIHIRNWDPPINDSFVDEIAKLTKGYVGADLKALCTEAALNSIKRKYPQIYLSNKKLKLNLSKIVVTPKDFMNAFDKIVPSISRSGAIVSFSLPDHIKPLLNNVLNHYIDKIQKLLPETATFLGHKKSSELDEYLNVDFFKNEKDGGFSKHIFEKNIDTIKVFKPTIIISGQKGFGQQYIGPAILNFLEGFQVFSLDLGTIYGDLTRTPDVGIVQTFVEAKKHQPSVIYISNVDIWIDVFSYSTIVVFDSMLKNLKNTDKVLILGISNSSYKLLDSIIKSIFNINESNIKDLTYPTKEERKDFFALLKKVLLTKPDEYINNPETKKLRKLKVLKIDNSNTLHNDEKTQRLRLKQITYNDNKLKNLLKIKLAGLMDLFKNRYKRFKKPLIHNNLLYHLFGSNQTSNIKGDNVDLYIISDDPKRPNMIKDVSNNKYYYNMDLQVIEERLWNGFYSEPKQFLNDIKMIVKDSLTLGDRERILKSNEMLTNALFGVDEFSSQEFLESCKEMRRREILKQNQIFKDFQKIRGIQKKELESLKTDTFDDNLSKSDSIEQIPSIKNITNNKSDFEFLIQKKKEDEDLQTNHTMIKASKVKPLIDVNLKNENYEKDDENSYLELSSEDESFNKEQDIKLIISEKIDEYFEFDLIELTEKHSIDDLEKIMAHLMNIVLEDKNNLDKTKTIEKLIEFTKKFVLVNNLKS